MSTPLQTSFSHRSLIAGFLGSVQPLGVTVLAEDPEKGVKLIGFAGDKLESFFSRFCDTSNAEGKTISNIVTYGESYDGKLIQQYRLTGYVSANGTLQTDGVELALTAITPTPSDDGKSKETVVADVYYPVLRGFCNDMAQLPVYVYDSKGAKAPYYYSALFRPQNRSFWENDSAFDKSALIATIPGLSAFAELPGFDMRSPTSASIKLSSHEEVETYKELALALPKDHPQALRPQSQGLRRIDDLGVPSYVPWTVVPNMTPAHYRTSELWADLIWLLPDSLKAPTWNREDVL